MMLLLLLAVVALCLIVSPVCLSRRVRRQEHTDALIHPSTVGCDLETALTKLEDSLTRGLDDIRDNTRSHA